MLSKQYLADFFFEITEAESIEALWDIFENFLKEHQMIHGRITSYDMGVEIGPDSMEFKRTYPEGPDSWGEHYLKSGMWVHDRSFHLIFEHKTEALEWEEMDRLTRQGTEANRVFVEMRDFGIGNGLLVGKSSVILGKTILMGIAGPSRVFKEFKKRNYQALLQCLHAINTRFLELAVRDDKLQKRSSPEIELTERSREIVRLMSRDYDSAEIAAKLNISENGVNQALKRLRKSTGLKTRAGIVAKALRAKLIQ